MNGYLNCARTAPVVVFGNNTGNAIEHFGLKAIIKEAIWLLSPCSTQQQAVEEFVKAVAENTVAQRGLREGIPVIILDAVMEQLAEYSAEYILELESGYRTDIGPRHVTRLIYWAMVLGQKYSRSLLGRLCRIAKARKAMAFKMNNTIHSTFIAVVLTGVK
tara:strand:+ start:59293 stop:59775 length:483 start_codon:yes stop_codon:yes gene_type:complete